MAQISPFELHRHIADSSVGADKVTVSVMMEQLGSISKCLDKIAMGGVKPAYDAEIRGEMADLAFHLTMFAMRRGDNLASLADMGEERYKERRLSQ
jgi:hypothetical protein